MGRRRCYLRIKQFETKKRLKKLLRMICEKFLMRKRYNLQQSVGQAMPDKNF